MPKILSDDEMIPVFETVAGFSEPASIEEINSRLPLAIPRRTLQRRLASLVDQGKLTALGDRGGRRYELKAPEAEIPATSTRGEIQLSKAALVIREQVTRPLSARRPMGYRSEFLAAYRPNVSATRDARGNGSHFGHVVACWHLFSQGHGPLADRSILELQPPGGQYLLAAGNTETAGVG